MQRQSFLKTLHSRPSGRTRYPELPVYRGTQKRLIRHFGSNSKFPSSPNWAAKSQDENDSKTKPKPFGSGFGGGWSKPSFAAKIELTPEERKLRESLMSQENERQQKQQQENLQQQQQQRQQPNPPSQAQRPQKWGSQSTPFSQRQPQTPPQWNSTSQSQSQPRQRPQQWGSQQQPFQQQPRNQQQQVQRQQTSHGQPQVQPRQSKPFRTPMKFVMSTADGWWNCPGCGNSCSETDPVCPSCHCPPSNVTTPNQHTKPYPEQPPPPPPPPPKPARNSQAKLPSFRNFAPELQAALMAKMESEHIEQSKEAQDKKPSEITSVTDTDPSAPKEEESIKPKKQRKRRGRSSEDEDDGIDEMDSFGHQGGRSRNAGFDRNKSSKNRGRRSRNSDEDDDGYSSRRRKAEKKAVAKPTPIYLPDFISVINLAQALSIRPAEFLRRLEDMGFEGVANDLVLDEETAGLIAAEFNFEPMTKTEVDDLVSAPPVEDESQLSPRPPVVTIMGHVDHGKTTLLDWLRKSSVVATEHGGITQHIGAFSVTMPSGKQITFLDTPGHAAFLEMRKRGADVTDIVILVVAADDGVKPQTIEAIKHAKEANVPVIVAINKIDKPDINIERVKQGLSQHGINVEDYGGDIQAIGVSGKTGKGMLDLEEAAITLSELLELKADYKGNVEGWVIESSTKKGGRAATILIKRGTLRVGDVIVAGKSWGKVRTLKNEAGIQIKEAPPGTPVEVDGWREQPIAGSEVIQAPSEQRAKEVVDMRLELEETKKMGSDITAINESRRQERTKRELEAAAAKSDGEDSEAAIPKEEKSGPQGVPFLIKGDVSGSVEAIINSISGIGNNEIYANIIRSGIGRVSEFDVQHASVANGHVISFNQPVEPELSRLAEKLDVKIMSHNIIYELIDDVRGKLSERLAPKVTQRVSGEADIGQVFEISLKRKEKTLVAGCKVSNGTIHRSHKVRVLRNKKVVYDGTFSSLRNVKANVTEMSKGNECGMAFENWTEFEVGDSVQTYEEISEKRTI